MNARIAGALLLSLLAPGAPAAEALETARARYQEVPREYRLDGTVEAVIQSTVSAQTGGQVEAILFDVDDFVEKGTVVVRLKDTEQQARLSQAAASLESAEAQLKEARDEQRRTREMFDKGLVAQAAMDKADAALKRAAAAREGALAALRQAQEQLEYTQVEAPYSGIVTRRFIEVGEIASPGQPLIQGLSLDRLRVNVDMPQSLVPAVREHRQASVRLPGDGYIPAEKITVYPFAESASNTFRVRLELPEGTRDLVPGMFVKTLFQVGTRRLLLVPSSAVVFRSEVTGVYVVSDDGRLGFRYVRPGPASGDELSILSGLEEGEAVALDPVAAGRRLKRQGGE